ncbi:MAG: FHA domain-containing protein [Myxococcota bacterium]|nr:FHA domain-containing protein [Myxococcota bacterium]
MDKERKYRFKLGFQQIDLPAEGLMVGRSRECTLTLEDPLVSRLHARITVEEGGVFLEDLGSRNGTLVNGKPAVQHQKLVHQDRVRIGGHELMFVEEGVLLSKGDRPTFALTICSACGAPFPEKALACPHCGVRAGHTMECGSCGGPNPSDAVFCAQCKQLLDGNTVPLQQGPPVQDWTDRLGEEAIERAIETGRFELATKMLEERALKFEAAEPGPLRTRSLQWYSERAVRLAKLAENGQELHAVVARWHLCDSLMPVSLLDMLIEGAGRWCDLRPALQVYLTSVVLPRLPQNEDAAQLDIALRRVLRAHEEAR